MSQLLLPGDTLAPGDRFVALAMVQEGGGSSIEMLAALRGADVEEAIPFPEQHARGELPTGLQFVASLDAFVALRAVRVDELARRAGSVVQPGAVASMQFKRVSIVELPFLAAGATLGEAIRIFTEANEQVVEAAGAVAERAADVGLRTLDRVTQPLQTAAKVGAVLTFVLVGGVIFILYTLAKSTKTTVRL